MDVLKPQNIVEEKILFDKEFLRAIEIGKPREGHKEGTLKNHILQILEYVEKNYKNTKYYDDLRIIALLHDTGKFAFLKEISAYIPVMNENKTKEIIKESQEFREKYYSEIPLKIKRQFLTGGHAYASYKFSKKFLKNNKLIKIIKYHDLAFDFMQEERHHGRYDEKFFIEVFSKIDIKLYFYFLKCDNCNRIDKTSTWLKKELKKHNLN